MQYTPIITPYAKPLSRAICRLMLPLTSRRENENTEYYCDIIDYDGPPSQWTGFSLLIIPDEYIPIHQNPDKTPIEEVLQVFVSSNAITQEEFENTINTIPLIAGSQIKLSDLIPESWRIYNMTKEQAIENGFIKEQV